MRFGFLLVGIALSSASFAGAPGDAVSIIQHGESALRGKSAQVVMRMTVKRPTFTRELKLRSWTLGRGHALVEILEPAKEEGIASLRVDDQMWNFLPKTDQTVRVPTSLMLQSWMGSDFTNDDLMKASSLITDYTHKILSRETLDGEKAVQIECLPKPNAPVVWGKILYWARVADDLPLKEAYYDESGKLVRTMTLSEFKKMDDRVIPTRLVVTKAENPDESTTVVYEKALYDRSVDEGVFARDRLRRTSQQGRNLAWGWSATALKTATN